MSISAVDPYSHTLLVQTAICADQNEAIVVLARPCEDQIQCQEESSSVVLVMWCN